MGTVKHRAKSTREQVQAGNECRFPCQIRIYFESFFLTNTKFKLLRPRTVLLQTWKVLLSEIFSTQRFRCRKQVQVLWASEYGCVENFKDLRFWYNCPISRLEIRVLTLKTLLFQYIIHLNFLPLMNKSRFNLFYKCPCSSLYTWSDVLSSPVYRNGLTMVTQHGAWLQSSPGDREIKL